MWLPLSLHLGFISDITFSESISVLPVMTSSISKSLMVIVKYVHSIFLCLPLSGDIVRLHFLGTLWLSCTSMTGPSTRWLAMANELWLRSNTYFFLCSTVCVYMLSHSVESNSLQSHGPCQAPLSLGFYGQECWSGQPFPPAGDLPNPGTELRSPGM